MIALILLILAIVVIGGGIEVVRRMRFGGGAAAAHHRALDTLGHLTNQGADRRVDLAPPAGTPLLDHVRRVVEADPTHPRISPRPMSRPVTIPAAVLGTEPPAPPPEEEVATRPAPTEIEGVRLLLPDPQPTPSSPPVDPAGESVTDEGDGAEGDVVGPDSDELDSVAGDTDEPATAADDTDTHGDDGASESDGDTDESGGDDASVTGDAGTDDAESDGRAVDEPALAESAAASESAAAEDGGEDHGGPDDDGDGRVAAAEVGTPVVVRIDDEAIDWATFDDDPVAGFGDHPWPEDVGIEPGDDHHDATPRIAEDHQETAQPEDLSAALAGTPVSPPTSADGAESVRVVRVADIDPPGDDTDSTEVHDAGPPREDAQTAATTTVPAVARARDFDAPAGPGDVEGFRILPPSEADSIVAAVATPTVTEEGSAGSAPPATDARPWWHSGGTPAVAGTFHPAPPEQTRAQLAALARSGGVEATGSGDGGGGPHRSNHRHSRRSAGHARSTRQPAGHRGLRMATAILAVIVAAVGVVSGVVISNHGSGSQPRAARPITPVTAAPSTTTTAPVMPAALVSRTASTATYQVTGSPTISFVGSGSCWIEIRQGDQTGKVLFQGVLSTGSQKSQTGPFWVRLGNPAAISVQINGMVLNQPASTTDSPYNLQFQ